MFDRSPDPIELLHASKRVEIPACDECEHNARCLGQFGQNREGRFGDLRSIGIPDDGRDCSVDVERHQQRTVERDESLGKGIG